MSYPSEVAADSPLVYWRLGESSGTTAADSSGNSRAATYTNSPTLGATSLLTGDSNPAMGVTANAGTCTSIASAAWMNVSTITVECLVSLTSGLDGTNGDAIVSQYGGAGARWLLWRDISGKFSVQFSESNGATRTVTSTVTPTSGTTYHLAFTYSGSALTLYVNGVASGTPFTGMSGVYPSTAPIEVGRYSSANSTTPTGTIDEVAVYGTALSSTRIAAHYAAATTAPAPSASGTASLSLTGSGGAAATSGGSGSLSLSGSGAVKAAATGSGSLSLSGSGDTVAPSPATGSGSLSLSGSGASGIGRTGAASLSLSGAGSALASTAAIGTASLSLGASGSATLADSGTGLLSLTASGVAEALYTTDTSNLLNGRVRRARATSTVTRPVGAPPSNLAPRHDKAVPLPPPTLVNGRVT